MPPQVAAEREVEELGQEALDAHAAPLAAVRKHAPHANCSCELQQNEEPRLIIYIAHIRALRVTLIVQQRVERVLEKSARIRFARGARSSHDIVVRVAAPLVSFQ